MFYLEDFIKVALTEAENSDFCSAYNMVHSCMYFCYTEIFI